MRISDAELRPAIAAALATVVNDADTEALADQVIAALNAREERAPEPSLLTLNGRVLVDLMTHPDTSLQQAADRLGLTSANVGHAMTRLVGAEWGVRTRVGRQNTYTFDLQRVLSHRDSVAFLRALALAAH
jgi:hypothetical protein